MVSWEEDCRDSLIDVKQEKVLMVSVLAAPLKVRWAGKAVFLFESLKATPTQVHSGKIFSIKRVSSSNLFITCYISQSFALGHASPIFLSSVPWGAILSTDALLFIFFFKKPNKQQNNSHSKDLLRNVWCLVVHEKFS